MYISHRPRHAVPKFLMRGFIAKRRVSKAALKGLRLPSYLDVHMIISPIDSMILLPRTFEKSVHPFT